MKKFGKIFSLILAVALLCTGLIMVASAEEPTFDLPAALASAESGATVTLTGNATLTEAYNVEKDVTIDLNGYTLTSTGADTFIIEGAYNVKIIGDGTVNLAGRLVKSSTAGVAYTFTMEGNTEIAVNHTAAAAPHVVYAAGGTHTFNKVNIVSTRAGNVGTRHDAFFRGTTDAETETDNNNTDGKTVINDSGTKSVVPADGTAQNLKFYFNASSFTCESSPNGQNYLTFMMLTGSGSYAEMNNTTVRNGGTLLHVGYTTETKMGTTLVNATNTHLQIVSTDNRARSCLVWAHKAAGNGGDIVYGSIKLKDSYLGGNVYRGVHAGDAASGKFQVVLDHSVIANNGANESTNANSRDTIMTRGADIWLKNNSSLISNGNLAMSGGKIYAIVGARFNNKAMGESSHITWYDEFGDPATGVKIVFDPAADLLRPYVSTTDSTKTDYLPEGARNMNFFTTEYIAGENSQSAYGVHVDKVGSFVMDFDAGWQNGFNNGARLDVTYGTNNSFKYWINPNADYPTMGGNRKFPNNGTVKEDVFFILGLKHDLAVEQQFAQVSNTKVAVSEFDIASDSEYGFVKMFVKTQARTGQTSGGDASGDTQFTIQSNGTISNGNLVNFNSSVTLSKTKWNHVTVVMYTDATYDEDGEASKIGQAFYYINGELLGYSNYAFQNTAGYVMGTRFVVPQNQNLVIGTSTLFDNFSLRAYENYIGEGEADGVKKNPEAYLLGDLLYNDQPVNLNVTVAGRAYADLNEAIKAANALGVNVELHADLTQPQVITENGVIDTNGYELNIDPASYGYTVDGNKYTFNEDYWYNVKWYIGERGNVEAMNDPANYVNGIAKLGIEVDRENIFTGETPDYEKLTSVTQDGWAYTADATTKVTAFVPTLNDLEAAKATADRTVKLYPVITEVPMAYYIKDAAGTVYAGSSNGDNAVAALKTLPSGHTFVLNGDVALNESALLFASTADAPKTLNIDLNGHTLARGVTGVMFQVGAYTTLNVYSSVAGGKVIATTTNAEGIMNDGGTAFVISDGTNNSNATTDKLLVGTRGDVTEAYINVGKFGDIPGSNVTVIAERAYYGFKGGEKCAITVDGVTTIAPGSANTTALQTYVYDGDIFYKNSLLIVPTKDNVVNIAAFSQASKHTLDDGTVSPRNEGFEDVIITAGVRFENVIIVNDLSGIGDGKNDNVVSNCGDHKEKALVFNNVVTAGRLNPSNNGGERVVMDGFVAAELHAATTMNPTAGTVTAKCNIPMTWQALDLGITENVLNFTVTAYNAATGEFAACETYNVVNNGVSTEGIANAYSLPMLTGATIYADDAAKVNWNGIGENANAKTEYYVPGTPYTSINAPAAAAYALNALKLVHDGTWTGIPEAGTVMTADVNVTPGYTVEANISGFKTNLSLYSDFLVNLYVPANLAQYITAVNGKALAGETVTIGEAAFYKVTAAKTAKEVSTDAIFEIALAEGEYTATKTVKVNVVDYATKIMGGEYDDNTKTLMYYMLSYASAAEQYLNGAASEKLTAALAGIAVTAPDYINENYAAAIENIGLDTIFNSVSVSLGETPAFVFAPNGKFAGKVTVAYGDNVREYNIPEGSTAKVVIEDMKIYNFAKTLTITAVGTVVGADGEQTVTGSFNLDTYAKYHTENAANAESATAQDSRTALDLIKALYAYVKVAEAYRA